MSYAYKLGGALVWWENWKQIGLTGALLNFEAWLSATTLKRTLFLRMCFVIY
jgi:hypothetical protein